MLLSNSESIIYPIFVKNNYVARTVFIKVGIYSVTKAIQYNHVVVLPMSTSWIPMLYRV